MGGGGGGGHEVETNASKINSESISSCFNVETMLICLPRVWPAVMYFAVVFGVPWLIWKLLSALCEW